MTLEDTATLVVFTYKGYQDQLIVEPPDTVEKVLKRRRLSWACVDEVYEPGSWHYDPETDVPTPNP